MKKIIVFYHKFCPDGFGAAWAAWKKFKNKAEYIAIQPRTIPMKYLAKKGLEIYILDNSVPQKMQKLLMKKNTSVVVIDHHGSAEKDVKAFPQNVFNNSHSGSVLAWKYFYPHTPTPLLLRYVEDVDLWKWKMRNVSNITATIYSKDFAFSEWDTMFHDLETARGRSRYAELGKIIKRYEDQLINNVLQRAELVRFSGKKVFAVNSSLKKLTSAIGNRLQQKKPPFSIVWYITEGELCVSLRSVGKFDVSKIATKFGNGGGHRNAAGFTIPFKGKFPWKLVKK